MAKKCTFIKADGSTCQAYSLKAGKFCYQHEPGKAAERAEARSRGGRTTANMSRTSVLIGEIVETVEKAEALDPGSNGKAQPEIKTLEDLQLFAEKQIQYINDNKKYAKLSQADRALMIRWSEFLLKLKVVEGLGAESRIRELEDLARQNIKQLN